MSYALTWELPALNLAARFLAEDPDGLRSAFDAVDTLIDDPRPGNAFPFGSTDLLRLRVGRYRVVYEINDTDQTINVIRIGRSA